ncbi:MAG: DUF885 domain-containing protein [Gammaproteobacteria bacterium]|nr:DUF885 domain-containing protein [Gammaproteobacteria bacterium]
MNKLIIIICMLTVTISACQSTPQSMSNEKQDVSANDRADSFFEKSFQESLAQSPMFQSYLGIKDNQDKWDDLSEEKAEENLEITRRQLKELRSTINPDLLDEQTLISYRLFEKNAEDEIDLYKWRYHDYPVNQMHGVQSQIPSFLINIHRVSDKQDAEDYISRLNGVTGLLSQVIANMKMRTEMKIVPPRFVFPYVISDSRNVIKGNPFEQSSEDSTLLADFKSKVNALKIEQTEKDDLIRRASKALENKVGPAFEEMIAYLQALEKTATTDDGAWKFPDGEAFYNAALRQTTTTNLTADEIHQIGLREVARIQNEMHSIMDQVGFKGSLKEFFKFTREDKQFYYPDTAEGRQAYLSKAKSIIETMESHLDQVFITKPKDKIVVKAVEAFREKSAGKAFYQDPAPDGSRPGTYYANLYRMADMPNYQMEALAYHEGIPGHHLQGSISNQLKDIPKFRKFGYFTAYGEGWGLYSEYLPKEMGFYEDPYSDFGRLAMEIWRACRLVVDTGIHAKRWTREQAIQYLDENTPNPHGDIVKAIERYIVLPSQATAYKIGMMKILELREAARQQLGDGFDIREFHDVILKNGALPLDVLEEVVNSWVANKTQ